MGPPQQAEAIQESIDIFGPDNTFCTPKPERLIKTIIELTTVRGDIILDCFAGSGTTGAIAQKLGRRWILVEMGEQCETHILKRINQIQIKTPALFRYFQSAQEYMELLCFFSHKPKSPQRECHRNCDNKNNRSNISRRCS